jgi:hypothetical protein
MKSPKKKKSKKKEKKRNPNGHAQACCVVCTAVFQWPCFFLVGVRVAYYQKKVEEVAIVSVEKPAGYLVALVSLCSFFFLLLVLFLHFVSSNCQYVLALLFNFASLLDCANP